MADTADVVFHAPPGWPAMPDDFVPNEGWEPAAYWGVAPAGWTFYTRNGQAVAPPQGTWRPDQPLVALHSGGAAPTASNDPDLSNRGLGVGLPSPTRTDGVKPRRRLGLTALVSGVALVGVVVAAIFVFGFVRERVAESAAAPLSRQQLVTAFDAGQTVDGMELTSVGEEEASRVLEGQVCTDQLAIGDGGSLVVSASGGGLGVDPATGLVVEGGMVNISAFTFTTTAEAGLAFAGGADRFGQCLVSRLPSYVQESPADNIRTTRTDEWNTNYVVMTHRNVIALIKLDTDRAKRAEQVVDDVEDLLDRAD